MTHSQITIELSNSRARIVDRQVDRKLLAIVNRVTSYEIKEWSSFDNGYVTKKVKLFSRADFSFPAGLIKRVGLALRDEGAKVTVRRPNGVFRPDLKAMFSRVKEISLRLRPYQTDCVLQGMVEPRGLFWLSTASGKTAVLSANLVAYDLPSLVLTHRKELLDQLQSSISSFTEREVGLIGAGIWEPKRWTVGLVNTLAKKLTRNIDFLKTIEYVAVDECQHEASMTFEKITQNCVNAAVRHGYSATCFRTDNSDLRLMANLGEVIVRYTTSDLIEKGWLARPNIVVQRIGCQNVVVRGDWHKVERTYIQENAVRNRFACQYAVNKVNEGRQVLVLVKLVRHGEIVRDMLINEFCVDKPFVRYMNGKEPDGERKRALIDFRNGAFPILIGTTIYNEGVDLPRIGAAVNLAGGDSDIATIQRLGRVLRKSPDEDGNIDQRTEQLVDYLDFFDEDHLFIRRHSRNRLSYYRSEPAFRVEFAKRNEDA